MKKHIIILFVLLGVLPFTTGCQSKAPNLETSVHVDISISVDRARFPTVENLYDYIIHLSGMDKNVQYYGKGFICYLSYIGEDQRPLIKPVLLKPGKGMAFDNITRRKKEVLAFKAQLKHAIDQLLQIPSNHKQTHLIESLDYQIGIMKENSFSDEHHILLITDAVEEGLLNFSILDPDEAKTELENQLSGRASFRDLSGFDITFVLCSSKEKIEISNKSVDILVDYLRKAGAEVRVRSNLIKSYGL